MAISVCFVVCTTRDEERIAAVRDGVDDLPLAFDNEKSKTKHIPVEARTTERGGRVPALAEQEIHTMASIPPADDLPTYLTPLPDRVEEMALRLAWVVVAVNLAGTVFGFWYYRFQLLNTQLVMWPVVPDSPLATLLMVASLVSWKVGKNRSWIHALAFVGNLKYGLWVVVVQIAINDVFATGDPYHWFLLVSHLGMGLQAFVIHRYAEFTLPAVGVATAWFGFNDIVDYFLPIVGDYHHTYFGPKLVNAGDHSVRAHDVAAAAAVSLTILATFLALAIRIRRLENGLASEVD